MSEVSNTKRKTIRSICVFCGSSIGNLSQIEEAVIALAKEFVNQKLNLIYGGGGLGIMGLLAKTIHKEGGKVTGIIPEAMIQHCEPLFGETISVPDMHTRKQLMNEKCDAFIALPGGLGTLEETVETITWSQLNIHDKPIIIFNYHGFYDHFKSWIKHASDSGFIPSPAAKIPVFVNEVHDIFKSLLNYQVEDKPQQYQWQKTYI